MTPEVQVTVEQTVAWWEVLSAIVITVSTVFAAVSAVAAWRSAKTSARSAQRAEERAAQADQERLLSEADAALFDNIPRWERVADVLVQLGAVENETTDLVLRQLRSQVLRERLRVALAAALAWENRLWMVLEEAGRDGGFEVPRDKQRLQECWAFVDERVDVSVEAALREVATEIERAQRVNLDYRAMVVGSSELDDMDDQEEGTAQERLS